MQFSVAECVILTIPFFAPLIIGAITGLIHIIINK